MERKKDTPKTTVRKTIELGIKAGVPTRNNRVYSEECLKKALQEHEEATKDRRVVVTNSKNAEGKTHFGDVACVIEGVEEYQVQVKIFPTPAGNELQNYIDKFGAQALVVSPVGVGAFCCKGSKI